MKLVNILVIKDELERLIRNYRFYSSTEAKYRYEAYKELSEWLDGLEVEDVEERTQHQIPMEDIENAAARYDSSMDCVGCFIGGAKWMEQQLKDR